MQKWRLSFHSSRPTKQIKKLWNDYHSLPKSDKYQASTQQKILFPLIDSLDTAFQISSSTVVEELDQEVPVVFLGLLTHSVRLIDEVNSNEGRPSLNEEKGSLDLLSKILTICESLCSIEDRPIPQECRTEAITLVLDGIHSCSDTSLVLTLLRLLKCLVNTTHLLRVFITTMNGLDKLIALINREDDQSIAKSARNLLSTFVICFRGIDFELETHSSDNSVDNHSSSNLQRGRAMSSSSIGSVGRSSFPSAPAVAKGSQPIRKMNNADNVVAAGKSNKMELVNPVQDQNPLKGLNYAWNVLSELLKNTPIAGSWFAGNNPNETFEEGRGDFSTLLEDHPFLLGHSLSAEDLEMERQRLMNFVQGAVGMDITIEEEQEDVLELQAFLGESMLPLTCEVHGLRKQTFDKIAAAQTPAEVIHAIIFLFSVLSGNIETQNEFYKYGIVDSTVAMLDRVERNLLLLKSCSSATRAAAAGLQSKGAAAPSSSASGSSQADQAANMDFSEYHHSLVVLILRIILDDFAKPAYGRCGFVQNWRGMLIKNYSFLSLLVKCLKTKSPALALVAVRVIWVILSINPINVVALEIHQVIPSMIRTLTTFLYRGKLYDSQIESSEPSPQVIFLNSSYTEDSMLSWNEDLLQFLSASLETLQVVSGCLAERDADLPLSLLGILLVSWLPDAIDRSDDSGLRCSNCEAELAVCFCLHDSCLQEQSHRLCEECDKVFHKSVLKRSHIRMRMSAQEAMNRGRWLNEMQHKIGEDYWLCVKHAHVVKSKSPEIREDGLVDQRLLYLKRRELLSALALASLRNIWDDRKVNSLPFPPSALPMLLFIAQHLLAENYSIPNLRDDVLPASDSSEKSFSLWTTLLDDSEPVTSASHDQNECSPLDHPPPEANQLNSRRILLSLLCQNMARGMLHRTVVEEVNDPAFPGTSDSSSSYSVEQLLAFHADFRLMIEMLFSYGGDALLVHCAIDHSHRTCLTLLDRHYIWWLLRECSLMMIHVVSEDTQKKLLEWFVWILRTDAIAISDTKGNISGSRIIEQSRRAFLKPIHRKSITFERCPIGPPQIHLNTRLMVVQELRLLLSGSPSETDLSELHPLSPFAFSQLPFLSAPPLTPRYSRGNSIDSMNKDDGEWLGLSAFNEKTRNRGVFGPCYSYSLRHQKVKDAFHRMHIHSALYELICEDRILLIVGVPVHAIQELIPDSFSYLSSPPEALTDMEVEIWWSMLVAFGELCAGNELAKAGIEERYGLQVISNLLLRLADEASLVSKQGYYNPDYDRVLATFFFELCINKGQTFCPTKPFRQSVTHLPKGVTIADPSTIKKSSSTVSGRKCVLQLFARSIPLQQELEIKFNQIDLNALSYTYYAHECSALLTWNTLRPVAPRLPVSNLIALLSSGSRHIARYGLGKIDLHVQSHESSRTESKVVETRPYLNGNPASESELRTSFFEHEPSSNRLIRRPSRRNISSTSVHSVENESRWESESVGKQSSIHGDQASRGSFSSQQSVAAVLQAFKTMPIGSFFVGDLVDSSTHSKSGSKPLDSNRLEAINNKLEQSSRLPFIGGSGSKPQKLPVMAYCDMLHQICQPGYLDAAKGIVLLHHSLLIRAGLSAWISEDSLFEDVATADSPSTKSKVSHEIPVPSSQKTLDEYYAVLRKHLGLFMPQVQGDTTSLDLLNWEPNYSSISLRGEKSCELLLSAIISSSEAVQSLLAEMLCNLIECNAFNSHLMGVSRSLTVVLTRLLPYLSEFIQNKIGSIIARMLAYSFNTVTVKSLLDVVQTNQISNAHQNKILFILGHAVEKLNPHSFVHFSGDNAFTSGLPLPSVSSSLEKGWTICSWLRLGVMSDISNRILLEIVRGSHCFRIFLRTVRVSNTKGSSSHLGEPPQYNRMSSWRKTVQLCWSMLPINADGTSSKKSSNADSMPPSSDSQCGISMMQYILGFSEELYDYGIDSSFPATINGRGHLSASIQTLLQSLSFCAFPNGYVDLSFEDCKQWHLLCLAISRNGVSCWVDGIEQKAKYFSSLGFATREKTKGGSGDSEFNFFDDESSSKDSANIMFGGLKMMNGEAYSSVMEFVHKSSSKDSPEEDLSIAATKVMCGRFLAALNAGIGGFVGSLCNFSIFDGLPESSLEIQQYFNEGCQQKNVKLGQMKAIASLGQSELRQYVSGISNQSPLVQKQQQLKPTVDDFRNLFQGMQVYTPTMRCERPYPILMETLGVRDDCQLCKSSVHITLSLSQALKNLGGYRCLFPLINSDSPQAIAIFRILEAMISVNDDYLALKKEGIDKALVYIINKNPKLINIEVYQAIFELVPVKGWIDMRNNGQRYDAYSSTVQTFRLEILETFMDLVIASNHGHSIARNAVDWLRDISCDSPKVGYSVVKALSILPFTVLMSLWTVGSSGTIEISSIETEQPSKIDANVQENDRKRVLFEGNSPQEGLLHGSESEQLIVDQYRLQLSCMRFFKQLFDNIMAEAHSMKSLPGMELVSIVLPPLICFAMIGARPKQNASSNNLTSGRKQESIRRSEKMKNTLRKLCGALPVLMYEDVLEMQYWQLSASMGCWLEIMSLLTGRFGLFFLNTIKLLLPGLQFSQVALELMASPAVELRSIGIRLLILYLAGPEGKLDSKQVGAFEKINGFHTMARQLSSHSSCDEMILEGLFALLFWQVKGIIPTSSPSSTEMSSKDNEKVKGLESENSGNFVDPANNLQEIPHPFPTAAGNHDHVNGEMLDVESGIEGNFLQPISPEIQTSTDADLPKAMNSKPTTNQEEELALPQILEALFCVLPNSKVIDQVNRSIARIQRCLGNSELSQTSNGDNIEELHVRNLESVFVCKDWLLLLCDMVARYRRQESQDDLDANAILSLSEPESLYSGPGVKRHDSFISGGDSEDCFSAAGESVLDESYEYLASSRRASDCSLGRRYHSNQFTTPALGLIRKLIILDMFLKPLPTRRWMEIFRLSLPETAQIQEEIVLDIVYTMQHANFLANNRDQAFNYLKNMGSFLEQVLERMKVSMPLCVAVVGALHALSYRCSLELRSRMKDTPLPDVKKSYIVRCLMDVGQEIYNKVHCVMEIGPSLESYISSSDNKPFSDSQVMFLLLGMMVECYDHLELLISSKSHSPDEAVCLMENPEELEGVAMALEMMYTLVATIQNCVRISAESRKVLLKILEHIPGDSDRVLEKGFTNDWKSSLQPAPEEHSASSNEDIERACKAGSAPSTVTQAQITSNSWWGSWSRSVEVSKVAETSEGKEALPSETFYRTASLSAVSSQEYLEADTGCRKRSSLPIDIQSFVAWYCAFSQRNLRVELHNRIQKEMKSIVRFAEKMRERSAQRLLKYSKTLQDKRMREKISMDKLVSDTMTTNQSACEKVTATFLKDIFGWVKSFKERLQQGHDVFHGVSTETKGTRSSGRDSASKPLVEPAMLVVDSLESFKIPEALIDFLSREASRNSEESVDRSLHISTSVKFTAPLTKIEALNALIQCFASGRRIAEG